MRVTVLLTVYNSGHLLQRAIDSVLTQSYTDLELLILDDGSTDPGVARILTGVTDRRARVHTFNPTPVERAATARYATLINWGAAHSSGGYLAYLAGDDHYLPDRLRRMVELLDKGHRVVYGPQLMTSETGGEIGVRHTIGVTLDAYHHVDLNSVMQTRESFELVGGWPDDPELWRDADAHMWRRLNEAGIPFVPVEGEPTDCKCYRADSVDQRVIAGKEPW